MSAIETGSVDMILADLPYGFTNCYWDSLLPLDQLWKQLKRIIKPNGAIVLTACQPFTTTLIASNSTQFRYCWYWHKNTPTGFCFAKFQPMRCMEDIVVFYRKMPTYNPQGVTELSHAAIKKRIPKKDSIYKLTMHSNEYIPKFTGYPRNLLEVKSERGFHPTQKPVALFEYLIKTYTNAGELVVDCCIGSGTTAVACIRTGRNFIGFEIDKTYFDGAKERIKGAMQDHA